MSLTGLQLRTEYRSDESNIVDNFYIPCLRESIAYYRAVGYFTSTSLSLAAKGLSAFVGNKGTMRLVASPVFYEEDIDAITRGFEARENIVERALLRQFGEEIDNYSNIERSRLECLAWLVSEGRLEIKVACRVDSTGRLASGIYHEKIGIFIDGEGNSVAFTGSPNETSGGLIGNFESFDVFVSWDDPHSRVSTKRKNFDKLWENATNTLMVVDFPDAAKRALLRFASRSYPTGDPESESQRVEEPEVNYVGRSKTGLRLPVDLTLRSYQTEAYRCWENNGYRGILSMATGTGKTTTALASLVCVHEKYKKVMAFVACPYKHLVDQWVTEAKRFGFKPILAYESHASWEELVDTAIVDFKAGARDNVLVITTHSTLSEERMQRVLETVKGEAVFVADEMHHLGSVQNRGKLPQTFAYRMGLSATPERWFDEEGTVALEQYFGKVVFEFPLERAIREGFLTEYYYHPVLVELSENEIQEYYTLTTRIAALVGKGAELDDGNVQYLLLKRADLLNNAESKLEVLAELVSKVQNVNHTLVYCTPDQLKKVITLLGVTFGLRVSRFTYRESTSKRKELLDSFASGELQALVAIRCLDEGVDVPSTSTAFLLASSGNPLQFIQRRGRILRKFKGKQYSEVYDLITIASHGPQGSASAVAFDIERRILRKELQRFDEFAKTAKNGLAATNEILHLAQAYNILDY